MKEYLKEHFTYVFDEEPEEVPLNLLVEEWGEAQIRKVLKYLVFEKKVDSLKPAGRRHNPYGLIDSICKNDKQRLPK